MLHIKITVKDDADGMYQFNVLDRQSSNSDIATETSYLVTASSISDIDYPSSQELDNLTNKDDTGASCDHLPSHGQTINSAMKWGKIYQYNFVRTRM